jgi:excinuclease UvrABC nuclease subunit
MSAGAHDRDTYSGGASGVDGEAGQQKSSRSNSRSITKGEGADAIECAKEQTREENTNEAVTDSVGDTLRNEGALVPVETLADSSQSTMHVESSVVVAPQQKPSPKQVRAYYVLRFTRRC